MPKLNRKDAFNFLSKLSFRRVWNLGKIYVSFQLSKWLKRPLIFGQPFSVSVEPTTACNLSCPECPSGLKSFTRPTGKIRFEFFKETVDACYRDLIYLNFYFQGEPYLHKGFLDMVGYASSKKIYTSTSTNAHFLTDDIARKTIESGLDRLIISIDGTTQETYQQYRKGGELNKVVEATSRILKWRRELKSNTPFIVFQFLVVRPNEHQIAEVKQLAADLGVDDVWLKTAQIYDYERDPNQLIPTIDRYSRYKQTPNGRTVPKNKLQNHCWKMWHSNVVTWDGKVVPCCFDKDASHPMGDLNENNMKQLWESKNYQEFRQQLMRSRKNIDICANCSEGLKVWS